MITKQAYLEAKQKVQQYEQELVEKLQTAISCICCYKVLTTIYPPSDPLRPEEGTWKEGTVSKIRPGYGSSLDGELLYIALCDDCLNKALKEGKAQSEGNIRALLREE